MIENTLRSIGGVGIFGIVSICLFFAFFSGVLIWAGRLKKTYLNSMGGLPLDEEQTSQTRREAASQNHHE
jgi:hypothetical protein